MDYMSLIYIAVGIIIIVFLAFNFLLRRILKSTYEKENPENPVHCVDAVIVSKRKGTQVVDRDASLPSWIFPKASTLYSAYYITFTEPNGKHIELMVGKLDYETLNEMDRGKLTYQGKLFKRFKKIYE